VRIGFHRAARVGDSLECESATDTIAKGEPTVRIGGKDAARLGDPTEHGGKIVKGCPTVRIGPDSQGTCMLAAAAQGAPMVESAE
jgi:uncharacterized Zn-binding protein involved in type VI secretion